MYTATVLYIFTVTEKKGARIIRVSDFFLVSSKESSSYFHVTWTDMIKLIISVIFKYLNPPSITKHKLTIIHYKLFISSNIENLMALMTETSCTFSRKIYHEI